MKDKINVAELLKDCPKGMELDCTMFDDVVFDHISIEPNTHPIFIKIKNYNSTIQLTEYGQYMDIEDAKCVIFPKGKTTWEGFVPPCKFKDGDIVFSGDCLISIFKGIKEEYGGSLHSYVSVVAGVRLKIDKDCWTLENIRFATEEEKAMLFQVIKDNGYKWNAETKTLEKLIEPKFKVGDRITLKNCDDGNVYKIIYVKETYYVTDQGKLPFYYADSWELVPDKFDINTLVPFESRVLIRDNVKEKWHPGIWGYYDNDTDLTYPYKLIGVIARYCIPYEGNEHLLGTNDDCDEYFKTWE